MSRWTVYVEGEREVRKSLQAAGQSTTKLTKVHRIVALRAKKDLKAAFPRKSGAARRSGRHKATAKVAEVRFSTAYIRKQEFRPHGKDSMRGEGWYFGPKAERTHGDWADLYWDEFTKMLDAAFGA